MADSQHDPERTPKPESESAENSFDRKFKLDSALVARAVAHVDALGQILEAITCANQLVTGAGQYRDAADPISSDELSALHNVLHAEFQRRLRIAEAAVADMAKSR